MNQKKILLVICLLAACLAVFLLWPSDDTGKESDASLDAKTEDAEDYQNADDKPLRIDADEWDEDEFAEDETSEILGTFARKEAGKTIFIYFDRQNTFLREVHDGDEVTKELGSYHLRKNGTLNFGNEDCSFERDGDDIIIDGKRWEYCDGLILSVV